MRDLPKRSEFLFRGTLCGTFFQIIHSPVEEVFDPRPAKIGSAMAAMIRTVSMLTAPFSSRWTCLSRRPHEACGLFVSLFTVCLAFSLPS